MGKTAFICSGQGSQYAGMGRALCGEFVAARQIYECAGDVLGFDLAAVSFGGDEAALSPTRISQPAIFAVSLAAYAAVRTFCDADVFGGHSLGEYAALTASGVFTLEDGFRVIAARAAAMQRAADENPGSMYAIIGSDEETVARVCAETAGYVLPVNFNSPAQTVIAGEVEPSRSAAETLGGMGAKAVKLAVSSAFHSKLMAGAAEELREKVASVKQNAPRKPFYSNVTGTVLAADTDLADYLARHMVSPVRFHSQLSAMCGDGVTRFVELGPNKVLTMLVKRGFKNVEAYNVEDVKTLEKLRAAALAPASD